MKKRFSIFGIMATLLLVITGCAASPQAQFTDYMNAQNTEKFNAGSFEMKVADIELDEAAAAGANNAMVGMAMSQLQNIKMTGDYQTDSKNRDTFKMAMNLDLMGMKIPFELMGKTTDTSEIYMSMDFLTSIGEIAQAFGGEEVPDLSSLDELSGKYVNLADFQETAEESASQKKLDKKEFKNAEEYSQAYRKEVETYMKGLDKKTFTKKNDTITHEFTKKEIIDLVELSQKVAKSDKKFKEYVSEDVKAAELFKEFKEFSIKADVDAKKNSSNMTIKISPANQTAAGFKKIKVVVKVKATNSKEKIAMPKKANIITKEEVQDLFMGPDSLGATSLSEETVSDEDFEELKAELVKQKANIDEATLNNLLETYGTILSPEQSAELKKAMK